MPRLRSSRYLVVPRFHRANSFVVSPSTPLAPRRFICLQVSIRNAGVRTLRATLITKKVRHLYEADIRGYFNHINHQWLMRMVAHRIADGVILRLIGK
jgi:hypothetical protein